MSRAECGTVFVGDCRERAGGSEPANAVALVILHGPRGGTIGSVVVDREDAERAWNELGRILGKESKRSAVDMIIYKIGRVRL